MINEKKLVEELKSLQVTVTGIRAGKGVLNEYAKHFKDSIIKGIEEQPKVGEWISVEDRLPDNEGMYLITSRVLDRTEVQYAFYQKNIAMFICNGKAIAWMPFPEPYRGDEK